jgi:hypothetical protein
MIGAVGLPRCLVGVDIQNPAPDWIEGRNQWELGHLARFGLQLAGFVALPASVLSETA